MTDFSSGSKICQEAFEQIKDQILKPHVLHLPALHQIQNGTPKLIGNASKRFPSAVANYSIKEKELSCDIKYIYQAGADNKCKLVVADEVTNYLEIISLHTGTFHKVGKALNKPCIL